MWWSWPAAIGTFVLLMPAITLYLWRTAQVRLLRSRIREAEVQREVDRRAIAELQEQARDQSRGLGFMRKLWPKLGSLIQFSNPVSENWQLDVRSLEIMASVVMFGPEIRIHLEEAEAQMTALPPQEVPNDAARH